MMDGALDRMPLVLRVRTTIAAAIIVLFYSQAALYLYAVDLFFISPTLLFLACFGVTALVAVASPAGVLPHRSILLWALFYATLSAVAFWISSASVVATEEVLSRFRSLAFLLLVASLCWHATTQTIVRQVIVAVVLVSVLLNGIDVVRPNTFSQTLGRAAGLYQNPNLSGNAITLGLLLGMPVVSRRWRPYFLIVAAAGVVLTLSRSAALGFAVASLALMVGGDVPVRRTLVAGVVSLGGAVLLIWLSGYGGLVIELFRLSMVESGTAERMATFRADGDESTIARAAVAQAAFAMFAESPWVGHGLGATLEWRFSESTHNMYLRYLAEYGIGGLLIIPWLVYLLTRTPVAAYRSSSYALAAFIAVWSMFSHNVLDGWPALAALGIALATLRQQDVEEAPA